MIVLACEGQSEVILMNELLDSGSLSFTRKDVLDRMPIHLRQPNSIAPLINILDINEEIIIYRIGDTQKDEFNTAVFGKIREEHISVKRVCTTPEIEMLIIINEHMFDEYMKVKSDISPKEFVKIHVKQYKSFAQYVQNHNMVYCIKEYKRLKKRSKGDLSLADLLKHEN